MTVQEPSQQGIAGIVLSYRSPPRGEEIREMFRMPPPGSKGIGDLVGGYAPGADKRTAQFEGEFTPRYERLITEDVMKRLMQDLDSLTLKLMTSFAVEVSPAILVNAVYLTLMGMRDTAREAYVSLRSQGIEENQAFESALEPFGTLIRAIQTGNVTGTSFYTGLELRLVRAADAQERHPFKLLGMYPHSTGETTHPFKV